MTIKPSPTWILIYLIATSSLVYSADPSEPDSIKTPRIESFPVESVGYKLIDWRKRSLDFVNFSLDPTAQGEYLPLMWWDDTKIQDRKTNFGLPSYVGMKGQWNIFRNSHESFVTLGTLVSGTWLGLDMSKYPVPGSTQPVNLVAMQEAYFSPKLEIFSDLISGDEPTGQTFFYELSPSIFVAPLCDRYPEEIDLSDKWQRSCSTWAQTASHLWRLNDYNFQSYDLLNKQAVVKDWTEPDVAAGLAYLMLMAHQKWPEDQRFYHECHHALMWMDLPYEGIKDRNCDSDKPGPYGCGDPTIHGWGPCNLGLYSGCLSGAFGSIIESTSDPHVICLNLNATDTFAPKAHPSRLVYNAGKQKVKIVLKAPQGEYSVWDTIHDQCLEQTLSNGDMKIEIPADTALVLVFVPSGATLASGHGKLLASGIVIDFAYQASPK